MYVGIDEIRAAAINLSPSAFKLYLYFVENEDGWNFHFFPKNFQNAYNVSESTYRNAKRELTTKGYIIQNQNNTFTFYSNPKDAEPSLEVLVKEMQRLGGHIKEYDINIHGKFYDEAKIIFSETDEEIKKNKVIDLVKRMRKALDELEEKNSVFKF